MNIALASWQAATYALEVLKKGMAQSRYTHKSLFFLYGYDQLRPKVTQVTPGPAGPFYLSHRIHL